MAKIKAVINPQPLTVETINNGQGFKPLSPNNLFITKSKVVMSPLGIFQKPESQCREREKGAKNLFILSKKDKSGQQQSKTSESMILYCLKKMHQEINVRLLLKQIQMIYEWLGA